MYLGKAQICTCRSKEVLFYTSTIYHNKIKRKKLFGDYSYFLYCAATTWKDLLAKNEYRNKMQFQKESGHNIDYHSVLNSQTWFPPFAYGNVRNVFPSAINLYILNITCTCLWPDEQMSIHMYNNLSRVISNSNNTQCIHSHRRYFPHFIYMLILL